MLRYIELSKEKLDSMSTNARNESGLQRSNVFFYILCGAGVPTMARLIWR